MAKIIIRHAGIMPKIMRALIGIELNSRSKYSLLYSREPDRFIRAGTYRLQYKRPLSARALILQATRPCAEKAVWFTRLSLLEQSLTLIKQAISA